MENKVLYTTQLVKDVEGIVRTIEGFNKHGDNVLELRLDLKPIDLGYLRVLFSPDNDDPDMVLGGYDITAAQAKALQQYVIGDTTIDIETYFFQLSCLQAPGWNWENGFPIKIGEDTEEQKKGKIKAYFPCPV